MFILLYHFFALLSIEKTSIRQKAPHPPPSLCEGGHGRYDREAAASGSPDGARKNGLKEKRAKAPISSRIGAFGAHIVLFNGYQYGLRENAVAVSEMKG